MKISIVIPTYNEARTLMSLLRSLARQQMIGAAEVLVVDGGSDDGTRDHVSGFPFARVVRTERGLMNQMHEGAKAATAPILWFLHADSTVPRTTAINAIVEALEDKPQVVGGCFRFLLRGDELFYKAVALLANGRTRFLNRVYGDQGIFCRADAYHEVGGFAPDGACGDADFYTRLRRKGDTVFLKYTVETSARTWQHYGKWRTLLYHLREWVSYEFQRGNSLRRK